MDKGKMAAADYCKKEKVMFVCITSSFTGSKPEFKNRKGKVYECTQKYWNLDYEMLDKANKADYICGTSNCIILGVYKNTSGWKHVREFESMKKDPEVVMHESYLDRYAFEGVPAPDEIWNRYVGKRIPEQCKHNQNKVVSFNF